MNWLRLRAQAICLVEVLVGGYLLFRQESLTLKLLGTAILTIATINNTIDGAMFYLQEVEEKIDKLAVQLRPKAS